MTDWNTRINRDGPALIVLLAMAVRLAYLIESSHSPLFDVFLSDADYYDQKARQILSGDWLAGREVFTMSPLYPYFLALLYRLTHLDFFWVKAIQHLIGALTAGLICRIGMILSGPATGLVAGGLAATYGLFLFADPAIRFRVADCPCGCLLSLF